MLKIVTFASRVPGKRLLVLGAIHGNEKCGTAAINRAISEIESGAIKITNGSVTFVPICNPRAYIQDVRFTERNLNRFFVPTEKPDTYEAELTNLICPLMEKCDALLDIHSYTAGGPPFVFGGLSNRESCEFAANLGDVTLVTGWAEAFAAAGKKQASGDESADTCQYARRFGAVAATLECGQHKDPAAPEFAYQGIRNAMRYVNITDESPMKKKGLADMPAVVMTRIYDREGGETLTREWKHLDRVTKGDVIGHRKDGTAVAAPEDGFLILPNTPPPQWFYFGVEKKF